eukprot:m.1231339 g.1231339  ORF g.1231339 m.1231339 type:complete len:314 (-) comp24659_c0_seq4:239-1180(-)
MAPVTEKVSKSRHIQFVSGVRGTEYWFGSYCFDAATSVTTSVFMTIVLALSGIDGLRGEQAGYVLVVLLFFIWAALPLVYSMTYMYKSSAGAYALTTMVFFLLTLVMVIVVFILPLLADGKYRKNGIAQDVKLGFFVNPLFACVQSIIDIYQNYQFLSVCSSRMTFCDANGYSPRDNYFATDGLGVGMALIFLFVEGIVFIALLFWASGESTLCKPSARARHAESNYVHPEMLATQITDTDVDAESRRIERRHGCAQQAVTQVWEEVCCRWRHTGRACGAMLWAAGGQRCRQDVVLSDADGRAQHLIRIRQGK